MIDNSVLQAELHLLEVTLELDAARHKQEKARLELDKLAVSLEWNALCKRIEELEKTQHIYHWAWLTLRASEIRAVITAPLEETDDQL